MGAGHTPPSMLSRFFHWWERRLAASTTDRVVRPFEWGLEWAGTNGHGPDTDPEQVLAEWADLAVANSEEFFATPPTSDYTLLDGWAPAPERGRTLVFPSAYATPHAENNSVYARYFPAPHRRSRDGRPSPRRGVVVLPQWNADPEGHVALCGLLARAGVSALRLSLPYHDQRMPPELHRADFIVSSNVARTVQVCRQAVMDARRAIAWLAGQGYDRIGILGTSLGSCLAMLTTAHEPLIRAQALNHVSAYFADVVWEGLSTEHVRAGLESTIDLDRLRRLWLPISPYSYVDRVRHARTLLVYARYDLTFPVHLSLRLINEFRRRQVPFELAVLPCGHYTTGIAPFKYLDGYALIRFLRANL